MLECSGASFIGAGVLHRAFSERFHVIVRYLRHGLELVIPNRFVASSENPDREEKKRDAAVPSARRALTDTEEAKRRKNRVASIFLRLPLANSGEIYFFTPRELYFAQEETEWLGQIVDIENGNTLKARARARSCEDLRAKIYSPKIN